MRTQVSAPFLALILDHIFSLEGKQYQQNFYPESDATSVQPDLSRRNHQAAQKDGSKILPVLSAN